METTPKTPPIGPEIRFAEGQKVGLEYRKLPDSDKQEPVAIIGQAIVCGVRSKNLGGFVEIIDKAALDEADMDDCKGLFNHNRDYLLGTVKAGTLTLTRTADGGLAYSIPYDPADPDHQRVARKIERGDVVGSSFAFRVQPDGDRWDYDDETGIVVRTVTRFSRISDVCPVTDPAYADTAAATRSFDEFSQQRTTPAATVPLSVRKYQLRMLESASR